MTTPTTEIKATEVNKLRQTTGAGLMDCKAALIESKGDMEAAIKILREKGIAKSSKRADRVAAEGLVDFWLSPDNQTGVLFELNSETDFVARTEEFGAAIKGLIEQVKKNPTTTMDKLDMTLVENLSAKVGEKISARRFVYYKANGAGVVTVYIHPGAKLGVLVQIDSNKTGAASDDIKNLGREIAIQIAGANPAYVTRTEVPADIIEREKEIAKKQMADQKKPPEMLEKIAIGKLQQFYEAQCLLDQPHVRDASGKTKIQDLVNGVAKKEGAELKVARFVRFRVGAE